MTSRSTPTRRARRSRPSSTACASRCVPVAALDALPCTCPCGWPWWLALGARPCGLPVGHSLPWLAMRPSLRPALHCMAWHGMALPCGLPCGLACPGTLASRQQQPRAASPPLVPCPS
jgi:hypothetical protein